MIRECTLEDISNGRTYELNDMVKCDTNGCNNCHKCCTGMGSSIVLEPIDIYNIKKITNKNFNELLQENYIELNMVDGLILPNIKMGSGNRCSFLNSENRCSIHEMRPGICRLFPLGRIYIDDGFKYFLQEGECISKNLTKTKIKKWIQTDMLTEKNAFTLDWHNFIKKLGENMKHLRDNGRGEVLNDISMYILNLFYVNDIEYDNYIGYYERGIVEATKQLKKFGVDLKG